MHAATDGGDMASSIQHSVIVIAGASGGIGRATAHAFAQRGASLILAARRPLTISEVARECRRLGAHALAVPLDVTDEHGLASLARKAVETFGHLDVWFNNAGVGVAGPIEDIPPTAVHRAMETNLMSCIYGARACLPHFKDKGRGTLINNACLLTNDGPRMMTLYVSAKWGVRGLGHALQSELAGTGIHVCTILSGPVRSSFFANCANFTRRQLEPPRRAVTEELVADAVVRCVEHPRAEVIIRGPSGTVSLNRHQIEPHPGVLFEPEPEGTTAFLR